MIATNGTTTPITAIRGFPLARANSEMAKLIATLVVTRPRLRSSSGVSASTPNGEKPASISATSAAVSTTTSTLLRPCSLQYTSSRCSTSANSSSTSPAPAPNSTAVTAVPKPCRPPATAPKPPTTISTMPGTTWWMCSPPGRMLRKGPFPARISRVITRVTRNVRTNEASASSSGSLPGSTMLRLHQ